MELGLGLVVCPETVLRGLEGVSQQGLAVPAAELQIFVDYTVCGWCRQIVTTGQIVNTGKDVDLFHL